MFTVDGARYYKHAELIDALYQLAGAYPHLVALETIGASFEGRAIVVATVTDRAAGLPDEKPGYWIDANIHAEELAGSTVALWTIAHLCKKHPSDRRVAEVLARYAFHVCPRVGPDGAERCLERPSGYGGKLRSSVRPYPLADPLPGLVPADVDGDGEILQMRIADPNGPWRLSDRDDRLLLPRRPGDDPAGRFFRLYREGTIAGDPAAPLPVPPTVAGLDLNRNFPFEWAREGEGDVRGGGPFPLSEPETRAVAAYLAARPAIVGATTYHTFSGVILRPYSTRPDEEMARGDLARYRAIGDLGTRLTGYPCRSVWHGFRAEHEPLTRGAFDDWCFEHLGMFAFTTELWSIGTAAGLTIDDFYGFFRRRGEDDELAILAWSDRATPGGSGFARWRPFDHPQLGPVELGGWRTLFTWQNPPPALLPPLCAAHARFTVEHAALGPRLELRLSSERVGRTDDGRPLRRVRAEVENVGWLPTQVVARPPGGERGRPVSLSISLAASGAATGAALVMGRARIDVGHLAGSSQLEDERGPEPVFFGGADRAQVAQAEWLVEGEGAITVEASAPRAGRVARTIAD